MKKLSFFYVFFTIAILLSGCGEREQAEMSKGHIQAVKAQCKNDPDKKLCGKEVRQKFKRDGHKYVNFKDLEKAEINRIVINCKSERQYGLVPYNDCLEKNKQLALGNELTQQDGEARISSNIDKIKQYTYKIIAFTDEESNNAASGTGVAVAKNYIATNCHVVVDPILSEKNKRTGVNADYYEVILVKNLFDESKMGKVTLYKKGYEKDLDICILKTKSDLKYVKKRVKHSKLKQRNKVVAVGNPVGIEGLVSDGKITALKNWSSGPLDQSLNQGKSIQFKIPWKIIHHDAAIGGGSSGGPLFDVGGNLIGLNTIGIMESTTGAFSVALSADHIQDVLRD